MRVQLQYELVSQNEKGVDIFLNQTNKNCKTESFFSERTRPMMTRPMFTKYV